MTNEFLFLCRATGFNGDGPDGRVYDAVGLVEQMRLHPEFLQDTKSLREHVWRTVNRAEAEALMVLLINSARYLSDVIGADVPVLASREVIHASLGIAHPDDQDALLVGKAMQRAVRSQFSQERQQLSAEVAAEVRRILEGLPAKTIAPADKYLTSEDMAARLDLAPVTVARLCARGLIDADKTSGGQWRTTEARLRRSQYLNGKSTKSRREANAELEQG